MTITDNVGAQATNTFTLAVNAALGATQAVPTTASTINIPLTTFTPVTPTNGTGPFSFAITAGGALPTGLTLNSTTGAVSGTPTAAQGATVRTITITDAAGATAANTFSLTINAALVANQAVPTTTGTQNSPLPAFTPVTATNGTAPYTFAITAGGALPAGLTLNTTTGQITGTPTVVQGATVRTITITDAVGATAANTFSLTINGPVTATQAIASRTTTVNRPFFPTATFTPVTASGGTAPYTFAITAGGALPTGVTFNTTNGLVSGTPTATFASNAFTVTITDNLGAQASNTFTLAVNAALGATQAVPTTASTINVPITTFTPVTQTNGTGPFNFAITAGGALPTGLTLNTTTGAISGTPTAAQGATVRTITITDAAGATAANTFSLTINAALVANQAVPSTTGTQNAAITAFTPVTPTNGTSPYTFAITAGGALPAGLTLNTTTGQITGTPTVAQGATVRTITITDAVGATAANTFSLTINGPLSATTVVPTITLQAGTAMTPTTPVTPAGGTAPFSFALTGGTLPTGVTFNTTNGQLTGTPTTALATTTFTVTITDNTAAVASNTFQLTSNAIQLFVNAAATTNADVSNAAACALGNEATCLSIPVLIDMSLRNVPNNDNLASLTVTINWDPTRFQYIGNTDGNGPGWSVTPNDANANTGSLVLGGFRAAGTTTNFTFHNVILKPIAAGSTPVTASISVSANELGANIFVPVRNLTVTITP